jgi:hypothetical protein
MSSRAGATTGVGGASAPTAARVGPDPRKVARDARAAGRRSEGSAVAGGGGAPATDEDAEDTEGGLPSTEETDESVLRGAWRRANERGAGTVLPPIRQRSLNIAARAADAALSAVAAGPRDPNAALVEAEARIRAAVDEREVRRERDEARRVRDLVAQMRVLSEESEARHRAELAEQREQLAEMAEQLRQMQIDRQAGRERSGGVVGSVDGSEESVAHGGGAQSVRLVAEPFFRSKQLAIVGMAGDPHASGLTPGQRDELKFEPSPKVSLREGVIDMSSVIGLLQEARYYTEARGGRLPHGLVSATSVEMAALARLRELAAASGSMPRNASEWYAYLISLVETQGPAVAVVLDKLTRYVNVLGNTTVNQSTLTTALGVHRVRLENVLSTANKKSWEEPRSFGLAGLAVLGTYPFLLADAVRTELNIGAAASQWPRDVDFERLQEVIASVLEALCARATNDFAFAARIVDALAGKASTDAPTSASTGGTTGTKPSSSAAGGGARPHTAGGYRSAGGAPRGTSMSFATAAAINSAPRGTPAGAASGAPRSAAGGSSQTSGAAAPKASGGAAQSASQGQTRTPGACFGCGAMGHRSTDPSCPKKART